MNGRAIERRNLLIFTTIAYEEGYGAYLPVVDEGIDLILYRERDGDLKKVQMKGRFTLNAKYQGRDIWIAFPYPSEPKPSELQVWYLARHDELIEIARELGFGIDFLDARGQYSRKQLSVALEAKMRPCIFSRSIG
jgi:hypothetical protein